MRQISHFFLFRIFNPASRYKTQAKQYRFFGPLLRFDHQQPLTKEEATSLKGKEDPRGMTYWGYTLSCCLVELFGDTKIVEFKDYQVAIAIIEQPLLLLDIRDKAAMAAGSVAAVDRLCKKAGISKKMSPHRIRHGSITAALDATNGNLRKVQKLSRHKDINTVMIYDDNRTNYQDEITQLLDDLV